MKKLDLTGKKIEMLTVICPTQKKRNGSIIWKCKCECGNTCYYSAAELKTRKSCGCLVAKKMVENHKKAKRVDNIVISKFNNKIRSDNQSGHTGVFKGKNEKYWHACLVVDGKRYEKRGFLTAESALKYRKELEDKFLPKEARNYQKKKRKLAPKNAKTINFKGEQVTFSYLSKKYNLRLSNLMTRYKKGLRDDELVKPSQTARKVECAGELLTLREIAQKYNLKLTTVRARYAKGLRGNDLIKKR